MDLEQFLKELEGLTGRPVAPLTASEQKFLTNALIDDEANIDYSQFNELLLIANKDRVELPFFKYFFVSPRDESEGTGRQLVCAIKEIPRGIERFQMAAMLSFGNFIYAYRKLSKAKNDTDLQQKLGDHCRDPQELKEKLRERRPKILEIEKIDKDQTYLVGYLSAREITEDYQIAALLQKALKKQNYDNLEALQDALEGMKSEVEKPDMVDDSIRWIKRFRNKHARDASVERLRQTLKDDLPKLEGNLQRLRTTQSTAEKNTDTYLTWDYLDIYFATSMRKRWEYEDLYNFVDQLMNEVHKIMVNEEIETSEERKLRYFDPTQSFDKNRIDKGLVEGLMLKRAACTVYSVQDTDTLGKDSELAATLAQGKAVIAYAPEIQIPRRTEQLMEQAKGNPVALLDRLEFVYNADDRFGITFADDVSFIERTRGILNSFKNKKLWHSIIDQSAVDSFLLENSTYLNRFCEIIATSEARIYQKRANTLRNDHPLGIQVNLSTGVANGVLVLSDISLCAKLLWRILTNDMKFDLIEDPKANAWLLIEKLSKSVYRVVTKNRKLTNCFWNFYPQSTVT